MRILEKKIREAETQLAQGQDAREKLRAEREKLSDKLSELKISEMELVKDYQHKELDISGIEKQLNELKQGGLAFAEAIKRQNEIISKRRDAIQHTKEKLESFRSNTGLYSEQIKQHQTMYGEHSRLVKEMQLGLKQINEAKEKLSGEVPFEVS